MAGLHRPTAADKQDMVATVGFHCNRSTIFHAGGVGTVEER